MKAHEELAELGIDRCIECNSATGDDWEYVPFSSKTAVVCPQCGELYALDCLREDQNESQ